jgi:hypothetical protein
MAAQQFYVRNPIMLGEWRRIVRVVGYDETKGKTAPYIVPRGHVVEVPEKGAEAPLEKWLAAKCLELYNEKKHKDAVLKPVTYATDQLQAASYSGDDEDDSGTEDDASQASPIPGDQPEDEMPKAKKPHEQSSTIKTKDPRGV